MTFFFQIEKEMKATADCGTVVPFGREILSIKAASRESENVLANAPKNLFSDKTLSPALARKDVFTRGLQSSAAPLLFFHFY